MPTYHLQKTVSTHAPVTPNVIACAEFFGLGVDSQRTLAIVQPMEVTIEPGQVVYITGGSGAGKSTLLGLLCEQMDDVLNLNDIVIPADKPVLDCFDQPMKESLNWLGLSGLSDAFALLRLPGQLSDGQRYRLKLAMAMAKKPGVIVIDEFCNHLDRVTAAIVSHGVRRFADLFKTTFLVATGHDDIVDDLMPDVTINQFFSGQSRVRYPRRFLAG